MYFAMDNMGDENIKKLKDTHEESDWARAG